MKIKFAVLLALMMISSMCNIVSAADPINVSVIVPSLVYLGQPFNIDIFVQPNGNAMAGMQMNLRYDPKLVVINSITEGSLLNPDGTVETFFVQGVNEYGLVREIYSVMLYENAVTGAGNFVTIQATAIAYDNTNITFGLEHVIIAAPNGTAIDNIVFDAIMVAEQYPPWDLNKDGAINILDLTVVAQHFGDVING